MEFIRFWGKGSIKTGIKCKGYYIDVIEGYKYWIRVIEENDRKQMTAEQQIIIVDMTSLIASGESALEITKKIEFLAANGIDNGRSKYLENKGIIFPADDKTLAIPIEKPANVLGIYKFSFPSAASDAAGTHESKKLPIIYMQSAGMLVGPGEGMILREFNIKPVWRVELGIIIGKECYKVNRNKIEEYIFGYTIVTSIEDQEYFIEYFKKSRPGKDLNYRDISIVKYFATCQDSFISVGPSITPKNDIDFENVLKASISDSKGNSKTIHADFTLGNVLDTITYISSFMTLKPGDLIHVAAYDGLFEPCDGINGIKSEIAELGNLYNPVIYKRTEGGENETI